MPPADPIAPPTHDDCHESHCNVVLADYVVAPEIDGHAGWLPFVIAADEMIFAISHPHAATLAPDELRPLPLRAHLRFAVLLI